ncbi:MAG: LapB repeat-containing protein [Culicoidibacterales bacterium]
MKTIIMSVVTLLVLIQGGTVTTLAAPTGTSQSQKEQQEFENPIVFSDFSLSLVEAKLLTVDQAIEKASEAQNIGMVDVDLAQLQVIKTTEIEGRYPLVFTFGVQVTEINIMVTNAELGEGDPNRAIVEDGIIKIDIPRYDVTKGWLFEDVYDVVITVDFQEATTTDKVVEITLPEGMRFATIPTKNSLGGIFVQADPTLSDLIASDQRPVAHSVYKTYNGKMRYNFLPHASKVEIKGLKITPDAVLYYGPKQFAKGIEVTASKESVIQGAPAVVIDARGDSGYTIGSNTWKAAQTMVQGDLDILSTGEVYQSRIGYLAVRQGYTKSVNTYINYPKGTTVSGIGGTAAVTTVANDPVGGIIHIRQGELLGYKTMGLLLDGSALAIGDYVSVDGVKMEFEMYDGAIIVAEQKARTTKITVLASDDPQINNKLDLKMENGTFDAVSDDNLTKKPLMSVTNGATNTKRSQFFEYTIDPGYEAYEVSFPAMSTTPITSIEYTTNFGKKATATGAEITLTNSKGRVYGYGINRNTLNFEQGEFIAQAKAYAGDFSKNVSSNEYLFNSLEDSSMYVLGRLKQGINSAEIEVNTWSDPQIKGVKEQGSESMALSTITRATANGVYHFEIPSVTITAGQTARVNMTLRPTNYYYSDNPTVVDPIIYLRLPEEFSVASETVIATKGGLPVPLEFVDPYITSVGQRVIGIRLKTKIGPFFLNENPLSAVSIRLDLAASLSAKGSFKFQDIAFLEATRELTHGYNQNPVTNDIHDVNNNGVTTEKLGRANNTTLLINQQKILMLDSYIVPENESRRPAYDLQNPATAVGFTQGAKAEYVVDVFNNRDDAVNSLLSYIPVPRTGLDFGTNFQSAPFKWNMKMQDSGYSIEVFDKDNNDITAGSRNNYLIEYSEDATTNANYENATYTPTFTDLTSMIRLRNTTGINSGERATIKFGYTVDETNESLALNPEKLNAINDFRPYFSFVAGSSGVQSGTRVGAKLQTGEVSGMLYNDVFTDGLYNAATDALVEDRTVILFKKNEARVYQEHARQQTNGQGQFSFLGLSNGVYKVDFNSAKLAVGEEFTLRNQGVDNTIDSDVYYVGAQKGIVEGINPTTEASKQITAGVITYNYQTDLKVTPDQATVAMRASNSQKTQRQMVTAEILPANFMSIKATDDAITWVTGDLNLLLASSGQSSSTLTSGMTTGQAEVTTATVTIRDMYGNSEEAVIPVNISSNDIPVITESETLVIEGGTIITAEYLRSLVVVADTEDGLLEPTSSHNIIVNPNQEAMTQGPYTVTYETTDSHGNTVIKAVPVTVEDRVAPIISTTKTEVIIEAQAGAGVPNWATLFGATATDIVDGNLTNQIIYTEKEVIPNGNTPGNYTVELNVEDSAGNVATTVEVTYRIVDTTKPIISTTKTEVIVEAQEGSVMKNWETLFGVSAADSVDGNITNKVIYTEVTPITSDNIPGDYLIRLNATDNNSNQATTVEVVYKIVDTTKPVISTTKTEVVVEAQEGSVMKNWETLFGVSAADGVDGNITNKVIYTGAVGIPNDNTPGNYIIRMDVNDRHGNDATTVEVVYKIIDTAIPTISTVKTEVTTEATAGLVTKNWETLFGVSAIDGVDGNITNKVAYTERPLITSDNIPGNYIIQLDVIDSNSNRAITTEVLYKIVDTTKPIISTTKTEIIVEAQLGLITKNWETLFGVSATDSVDGNITSNVVYAMTPEITSDNLPGNYTLKMDVTDSHSNQATTVESLYKIVDTTKPIITTTKTEIIAIAKPGEITENWSEIFGVSALDTVDGDITSNITYTEIPIIPDANTPGTYKIKLEVGDSSNNRAIPVEVSYKIIDKNSPLISTTKTEIIVEATTENLEKNWQELFGSSAIDVRDGDITNQIRYTEIPTIPNAFAQGTYTIRLDVTDTDNNAAVPVEVTYKIIDTTPPVLTIANLAIKQAPKMEGINQNWTSIFGITAIDIVDGDITTELTYTIDPKLTSMDLKGLYTIIVHTRDQANNQTQQTMQLLITDDLSDNSVVINADNFKLKVGEVPTADYLKEAKAEAFDTSNKDEYRPISLTIENEVRPIKPGVYPLTFITNGHKKTVQMVVTSDQALENQTELITANNFTMVESSVTTENLIQAAQAKAWNIENMAQIKQIPVTTNTPIKRGWNQVTFTTVQSTEITVNGLVTNQSPINSEAVVAYDFTTSLDQIDQQDIVALAKAKGYDVRNQSQPIEIPVKFIGQKPETAGTYTAHFETENGGYADITMTITTSFTETIVITAVEATVELVDVQKAIDTRSLEAFLIEQEQIKAYHITEAGSIPIPVSLDMNILDNQLQIGTYYITANAKGGTSTTRTLAQQNELEASKVIRIIVVDTKPTLSATGEQTFKTLLTSIILTGASIVLLGRNYIKKKGSLKK